MTADLFRTSWGDWIEVERRTRIKLCVAAYAYEINQHPIITDAQFDALALSSNRNIRTGLHDVWWRQTFQPYTGSWIHSHPDLTGIEKLYKITLAI